MFCVHLSNCVYLFELKMKKSLAIFLAVLYLTLVSGVSLQLHYCGGKLNSVKLAFIDNDHNCSCGSKTMKKGCCKNQSVCIKIQGDQRASANSIIFSNNLKNIAVQFPSFTLNYFSLQHVPAASNYHSPPPKYSNSLLILNNTFRI